MKSSGNQWNHWWKGGLPPHFSTLPRKAKAQALHVGMLYELVARDQKAYPLGSSFGDLPEAVSATLIDHLAPTLPHDPRGTALGPADEVRAWQDAAGDDWDGELPQEAGWSPAYCFNLMHRDKAIIAAVESKLRELRKSHSQFQPENRRSRAPAWRYVIAFEAYLNPSKKTKLPKRDRHAGTEWLNSWMAQHGPKKASMRPSVSSTWERAIEAARALEKGPV